MPHTGRTGSAPVLELRRGEDPAGAMARLLRREIEAAGAALSDPDLPRLRAVHAARRHIKRARTAVRLLAPVLGPERRRSANAALREAAHSLSGDRDADVLAALARQLADEAVPPARDAFLVVARRADARPRRGNAANGQARAALARARTQVQLASHPADSANRLAGEVIRLYAKGRKAMRQARKETGDEALHEWRKRVKDRWHVARLLKQVWPGGDRPKIRKLDELGELLGVDHDLAVLAENLEEHRSDARPEAVAAALDVVRARRKTLRREMFSRGDALYRRSAKDFAGAWKNWP